MSSRDAFTEGADTAEGTIVIRAAAARAAGTGMIEMVRIEMIEMSRHIASARITATVMFPTTASALDASGNGLGHQI